MKTNWKRWLLISVLAFGVLIILDARVNTTASGKALSVEVSDPVTPTILPPISEWNEYTGEVVLNTEINPRLNATGIIYDGPGGLLGGVDSLLALQAGAPAATDDDFLIPIVNIDGQGYTGVNPPDTVGDVGPNHYIQMINGSGGAIFRVYDKTGNPLTGSIDLDSFGTGACAGGIGDPVILYDQMADRWMLTEFSGSANVLCVYISQGPDPINDGWYAYNFTTPNFPDYPKYGVWPDGYYVTSNENSPAAYALDRVNMLIGAAATSIRFTAPPLSGFSFQALTPSDLDGEDLPPAGAPNYFMRHRDTEAHGNGNCTVAPDEDCLEIWAFHADFATPANSTFTEIADINIADFDSELCGFSSFNCFQQPGTGTTLDPLREVIMFRLVYRNFGTYEALVGNLVTDVDDTDHGGVRWFELRKQGAGAWNLYQEGTYAPDSHSRWMGAIAMDGSGNIAVGYNVSSTTQYPSLRYAGRLVTDPLGTLPQSEGVLVNGTASNSSNRYGDYSAMSVDPSDDCTFWFTGEYNNGGNWSTRIGAFKFEACGSPFFIETTPATAEACIVNTDEVAYTVAVGQNVLFTDPVTLATGTLPANVSADFSVNPVTPADPPATSTLTLSGLTGSSAGSYSVAVTGAIPTRTMTSTVQLSLYDALTSPTNLLTPTDGETDVTPAPTFSWDAVPNAQGYDLEIATDAAFTNIVFTASTTETTYGMPIALDELHTYYWRVRPTNLCGEGVYSNAFSFTTREVPSILVVDDDDNSPNVRTYYTVALDDLGWAYDVWDTTTIGGEPTAPDLAPYQTVIWFTGDQTSGTTGPDEASETALSTWLDNAQGCFLLSSQDYYQDQGLTPFMTDYLGVGTLSEGEGNYGQVIGEGVFGALGTRSLLYPFTDSADWITPGAAALGWVGTNDRGAALTKEAGYKTSFWVFPFEAIYGAANRRNAMDAFISWCGLEQPVHGVTLSADQGESSPAGTAVMYEISITNTGNVADLFNLSLTGNVWASELSVPNISLNAGETATFIVVVTIPADAGEGTTDSVTVTATSVSDGAVTATTTLTTTVAPATLNVFLPIVIR